MSESSRPNNSRKLRKGTLSCWACKRRKVRCVFTPSQTVCDSCRRRHKQCILQDVPDPGELDDENHSNFNERLALLETATYGGSVHSSQDRINTLYQQRRRHDSMSIPRMSIESAELRMGSMRQALLSVWPGEHVMDIIQDTPLSRSTIALKDITRQPRTLSRAMPHEGTPIAEVAFQLLHFASLVQIFSAREKKKLAEAGIGSGGWAADVVDMVNRAFLSDHTSVSTNEGLKCLLMEIAFHNSAGDLDKAFVSTRRALSIAQLKSLHSMTASSKGGSDLDHFLWFRIVQFDSYLSMVLGIPSGVPEGYHANAGIPESCGLADQFDHMVCSVGSLILKRRNTNLGTALPDTCEIDQKLREAASIMPPRWWLMPQLLFLSSQDDTEGLEASLRQMMSQLAYYHLLVNLHLPQIVTADCNGPHRTGTAVGVDASRQVLARVIACHEIPYIASCCRGIDYLALTAGTALCVARARNICGGIASQSQSDRGLLESSSEIMLKAKEMGEDKVAGEVEYALKQLRRIDDDSRTGTPWTVDLQPAVNREKPGYHIAVSDNWKQILVSLPHSLTIRFRAEASKAPTPGPLHNNPQPVGNLSLSGQQDRVWWTQDSDEPFLEYLPPLLPGDQIHGLAWEMGGGQD